jgi:signal transduction histidine kinase
MSIHDDGPGIATDDIGRLFQPFERLGAAQTGIDGTGLGLTLSKTLINAMSGEIGVDSEVGRGSTFWIALPATHPGNVALSPTQLVQLRRDPVSTAPQTALYIDDNLPNVRLVERIFTLRPASTLLVATLGSSGIAMALEHRPDVILLDLHLPDMTGVDVLKRLRAEPATATTPIIIVSADATTSSPKRLRELGATDFITKPFDIRRLLDLVDAATGAVAVPLTGTAETAPADADHAGDAQPDQYIVDFVHDLNNTLSVIMNHSILLGHNVADPAAQAGLQQIQRSTELVAAQARALMEHARGRAGSADG